MSLATLALETELQDLWFAERMDRTDRNVDGGREFSHLPVLLEETVRQLVQVEDGTYVDGTTGEGGHSQAILESEASVQTVLALDLDPRSLETAQSRLAAFGQRFRPIQGNYADMVEIAAEQGIKSVDGVLLDLGFSSRQVDSPGYGLSFQVDEALDMRYDPNGPLTAEEIVNTFQERELGQLIRSNGEEPRGMRIARAIVDNRPVATTGQLAEIVVSVLGRRPGQRVNPATKTFQALRIAVNDEFANVARGLEAAVGLLAPEGRLAVISYHSLEDRIVKSFFNREAATCLCPPGLPVCTCGQIPRLKIINRRVIRPSDEEVHSNPRSRSAKLRVAQRVQQDFE